MANAQNQDKDSHNNGTLPFNNETDTTDSLEEEEQAWLEHESAASMLTEPLPSKPSPAKPQSFAELSRLASESKSAWSNQIPGQKADRQFLLLIIVTIILVSAITLIGGFREPLSLKLNTFKNELAQIKETAFPDSDAELQSRLTHLKTEVLDLKAQIKALQMATQLPVDSTLSPSETVSPVPQDAVEPASLAETASTDTLKPLAVSEEEPLAIAEEKPLAAPKKEPSAVLNKEPSAALHKEPSAVLNKEPSAEKDKTPSALINETLPTAPGEKDPAQQKSPPTAQPETSVKTPQTPANWFINVGTYSNRKSAEELLIQAKRFAENTQIEEILVQGKTLYRIRATGYASRSEAELDAQHFKAKLGLSSTWISLRN